MDLAQTHVISSDLPWNKDILHELHFEEWRFGQIVRQEDDVDYLDVTNNFN